MSTLPLGKLPADLMIQMLDQAPSQDERLLLGPGIGLDCAVLDMGERLLVVKSDPITFATDKIGWYVIQINANDIATTGAVPRWFVSTLLLPEGKTTPDLIEEINIDLYRSCREMGITVIGGHTEITHGLNRPVLIGTLLGEVDPNKLITPKGARPGDRILLTKGVPIETTAILAREFPDRAREVLGENEWRKARHFLHDPGISVLQDARIALEVGGVTAMHDPTEGGLAAALWELAIASERSLVFLPTLVAIPTISEKLCRAFGLDPLGAIASGALLLTVTPQKSGEICQALKERGIACAEIGVVEEGPAWVWKEVDGERAQMPHPERDEIAALYE